jgi:ParB family transcriptional regulator, chromosome partitioning protein
MRPSAKDYKAGASGVLGAPPATKTNGHATAAANVPRPVKMPPGVMATKHSVREVPIGLIHPDPGQPRKTFDPVKLQELADQLETMGQLQNAVVWWDEAAGKFYLICGERRFRASQLAKRPTLTCMVFETKPEKSQIRLMQFMENEHEEVPAGEKAEGYKLIMKEQGWSARQLAEALKVEPSTITRAISLLSQPEPIQAAVNSGALPASSAAELRHLAPSQAMALASEAVEKGLTREEIKERVVLHRATQNEEASSTRQKEQGGGKVVSRERGSAFSWLTTCPPGDVNFKSQLTKCDLATAQAALEAIDGKVGKATACAQLRARIKFLKNGPPPAPKSVKEQAPPPEPEPDVDEIGVPYGEISENGNLVNVGWPDDPEYQIAFELAPEIDLMLSLKLGVGELAKITPVAMQDALNHFAKEMRLLLALSGKGEASA